MKSLGQVGYDAYGDHANWKNYQGEPMPNWEDLPADIRLHWETAAGAIVRSARG
jgi:hypothetical protein